MSGKVLGAHYAPNPVKLTTSIPPTPNCCLIRGSSPRENTRELALRVTKSLSSGEGADELLVFAATPNGETALTQAILSAAGDRGLTEIAAKVRVTTMRAFALEVLANEEARTFTGRDARLLAPFEESFLMQDMLGYGMEPKRLRGMLQFFYKTLSELGDDNPYWLINDQETTTFSQLRACLGFTRGILEPELSNLLVKYLRSSRDALAHWACRQVFVDGYHLHCRASQFAANLLARDSIVATTDAGAAGPANPAKTGTATGGSANPSAGISVFESYPYAKGPAELVEVNPQIDIVETETADEPQRVAHASDTPFSEMAHLRELAQTTNELYVAAPNRVWAKNAAAALAQQHIPVELAFDKRCLTGDIRNLGKCRAEAVLTVLALIANHHDCVAWRSWCGFGDWLANCGALKVLRSHGAKRGVALDGALAHVRELEHETLAAEAAAGLRRIEHAVDTAKRLIKGGDGLSGRELLAYVTANLYGPEANIPDIALQLCLDESDNAENEGNSPSAAEMLTTAFKRMHLPRFRKAGAVRVGGFTDGAGLAVEHVAFVGMVNGFIPELRYFDAARSTKEQRRKIIERDQAMRSITEAMATGSIEYSWFNEAPLELAEKTSMKIERIGLRDGKRMARLSPSALLEDTA